MLGPIVRSLLKLFYRVELRGREHYEAAGERTLILHNPGSIIDPLLIAAVLPHRVTLLADKAFEHKWWMRPICSLTDKLRPRQPDGRSCSPAACDRESVLSGGFCGKWIYGIHF